MLAPAAGASLKINKKIQLHKSSFGTRSYGLTDRKAGGPNFMTTGVLGDDPYVRIPV